MTYGDNIPSRLLVEAKTGRTLVHDSKGANGTSNKEEEGGGPDGPGDGVPPDMDEQFDEHENDGTKTGRADGRNQETGENGTDTVTIVPAPSDTVGAAGSDTDTNQRRHERVCGGDGDGVARAPHDPHTGAGGGTGESEELDAGVAVEAGR